jgi:subtilisin family serine protease
MRPRFLPSVPLLAVLALAACQDMSPTAVQQPAPQASVAEAIPGQWIVVFNAGVSDVPGLARQLTATHRGNLRFIYQHALKGFAASLPDAAVTALQHNPNVAYVEADQPVHAVTTQTNATWGLDRIDQRALPLSGTYSYDYPGAGVHAYIIDTGILLTHNDFGGRASSGFDAVDGGSAVDCNGHGTHVAGTVGGTTWGVAKGVTLVAVRVLNCSGSGTTSGVIAGVDWVTANRVQPAVANMSLSGGASSSLDNAVINSIGAGVSYAVAAGNGDWRGRAQNACNYSPARVAAAMTIGATDATDKKASWSNYGSCVDWFAPGVGITSAWYSSNTATNTISGTSMATPHTAGVAALYLEANPTASPAAVRTALYDATTKGIVTSSNTANNHLLYNLYPGSGGSNNPPTAGFTFSCTNLSCSFTDASTDPDGSIASRSWAFGDGATSTATNPSYTYAAGGTYTVTLTVTDDDGATDGESKSVTVASGGGGGITLSAVGYKVKGVQNADLTWSGATGTNVDVWRNNVKVVTANDGFHTDNIGLKGGGSYTYKVCEAGTSTCSNTATVTF